jgi:hypothetical protein
VVYCTGLENRRTETFRGFESRPLRHCLGMTGLGSWIGGFCSKSEKHFEHDVRNFPSFQSVSETGDGVPVRWNALRRRRAGPSGFFRAKLAIFTAQNHTNVASRY